MIHKTVIQGLRACKIQKMLEGRREQRKTEPGPEVEHQKAVQGVQNILFVCRATGCCAGQCHIYYVVSTEFVELAQTSFFCFS